MNFLRKSLILLFISTIIFSSGAPAIYAEMVGLDPISAAVTEKALSDMMSYFGVDQTALKETVQYVNVARQKKTPPQVKLTFTPSSPVPGMQITASASATYFMNDPALLYYGWYLKRGYCKTIDKGDDGYNTDYVSRCDLNNDDNVDIEDYKIEAMRLVASGDFDWQRAMGKDAPICDDQPNLDYCNAPNQYKVAKDPADGDGYEASFGGDDQKGKANHCYVHHVATGNETEIKCENHLFPNAPDEETGDGKFNLNEEEFWHTNPNSKDTTNSGVMDEAAVAGFGRNTLTWNYVTGDEIGVAVEGISVESTNYDDSSYKITWAISGNPEIKSEEDSGSTDDRLVYSFSQPGSSYGGPVTVNVTCSGTVESHSIPDGATRYEEGAGGASFLWKPLSDNEAFPPHLVVLLSGDHSESCTVCIAGGECGDFVGRMSDETEANITIEDVNTTLLDGFIEPSEGNSDEKMEVSLSYQPKSPMNSESADSADQLIVQSSIMGVENKSFLKYAWQIYLSSDIAAEDKDWKMLTLAQLESQTGLKKLSGIGIDSLKMNLNFKASLPALKSNQKTFYAKIILRAIEGKKEGVGTIIIPIQLSSSAIKVFSASVSDSLTLGLNNATERCNVGIESAICPVVKNEIIGVKVDIANPSGYDFLWSFDNAPLTETKQNIAYIPILGGRDSQHILSLEALNKTTGEKIILSKTFRVVDPAIFITSTTTDTCAPTLLGYYIDPINVNPNPVSGMTSSAWPDFSLDKFEALSGEVVKIKSSSNTLIPGDNASWIFDGIQVTTDNMASLGITAIEANGTLVFTANKPVGEKYDITLSALYTQPNLVKKALFTIWKVPQTNFYEKSISQTIEIKMVNNLSGTAIITGQNKNPQQKILASLFSAIPSYINFLFRIALTMLLILFLVRTLFSLFPEQKQI
jgi:hypothetical protein